MMKKFIRLFMLIACFGLVGCGSSSKELNLNEIDKKLAETDLFSETEKIDLEYLEDKYGLISEGIVDYSVYMARASMSSSMYAIFKVENDEVKSNIESNFINKYTDSWTVNVYDAHEANLVNNMYSEKYQDYLIYIISEDNDKVLNIIKG